MNSADDVQRVLEERIPEVRPIMAQMDAVARDLYPDLIESAFRLGLYELLWECFYEGVLGPALRDGRDVDLISRCLSFTEELLCVNDDYVHGTALLAVIEPMLESYEVLSRARTLGGDLVRLEIDRFSGA